MQSRRRRVWIQLAIAVVLTTASAFVFDPSVTLVIGGVSGLWVLVGVASLVHDAASKQ